MYNINRFVQMHEIDYQVALNEIKSGKKRSHWMWYIFPQLKSLGHSSTAKYYGIENLEEATEYLENEYLRKNMFEICNELLKLNKSADEIFGYPDNLKLNSCMTLFSLVSDNKIFDKVIDKFYNGIKDELTMKEVKNE